MRLPNPSPMMTCNTPEVQNPGLAGVAKEGPCPATTRAWKNPSLHARPVTTGNARSTIPAKQRGTQS